MFSSNLLTILIAIPFLGRAHLLIGSFKDDNHLKTTALNYSLVTFVLSTLL